MSVKRNPYIRKILYLISVILLIALFVVLKQNQSKQICQKITIEIDAPIEKQLVTERLINNQINKWYVGGLLGISQANLSLPTIEKRIQQMPSVKKAEVSFDLRGELLIEIEQRIPVMRVIPLYGISYYVAKDFTQIPAYATEVARVPIVNGNLTKAMIKKVYTLSTYVQENEFMEALTEQIFVDNNNDLIIIPKIKNQRIVIGDTALIPEKFDKLELFYKEGLSNLGWEKYHSINLKYKNQIVCK
jgi:cell division protein FtsQ